RRGLLVADSTQGLEKRQVRMPAGCPEEEFVSPPWSFEIGDGPVVATAIHSGHEVRPEVAEWMAIDAADRLREEDPLTGFWTSVGDSSIRVYRSRFEMDLNRPRDKAVALHPEDCWGLELWRARPPESVIERSL